LRRHFLLGTGFLLTIASLLAQFLVGLAATGKCHQFVGSGKLQTVDAL
jgi:hypothetical protein